MAQSSPLGEFKVRRRKFCFVTMPWALMEQEAHVVLIITNNHRGLAESSIYLKKNIHDKFNSEFQRTFTYP